MKRTIPPFSDDDGAASHNKRPRTDLAGTQAEAERTRVRTIINLIDRARWLLIRNGIPAAPGAPVSI